MENASHLEDKHPHHQNFENPNVADPKQCHITRSRLLLTLVTRPNSDQKITSVEVIVYTILSDVRVHKYPLQKPTVASPYLGSLNQDRFVQGQIHFRIPNKNCPSMR